MKEIFTLSEIWMCVKSVSELVIDTGAGVNFFVCERVWKYVSFDTEVGFVYDLSAFRILWNTHSIVLQE